MNISGDNVRFDLPDLGSEITGVEVLSASNPALTEGEAAGPEFADQATLTVQD